MSKDGNKKILMVVQYPENVSPGQRFRFELYKDLLRDNGFTVITQGFLDKEGYAIIYKYGYVLPKLLSTIKGFFKRIILTFQLADVDYIFLQREVTPVGPPVFEWIYTRVLKKKVIYDFDDAIWIPSFSKMNRFAANFRDTNKVSKICKWSFKVSCGNEYLCNYARRYNSNVFYNPTCVDTDTHHNMPANHDADRITIGWTGSFSTVKYLDLVQPVLKKLQEKYDFDIKIICNQPPSLDLAHVKYIEWTESNEVTELATCQIGLMPLTDDELSKGKCGFKLIQYLALEIPAVSSPVGVNTDIIEQDVNGFLAKTDNEWYNAIEKLILDKSLRKRMGRAGREKVEKNYSLRSNAANFLSLFNG